MLDAELEYPCPAPAVTQPAQRSDLNLLLNNVAAGNRTALKALYHAAGPRLFAVLVRMTRSREIAEDLLQDTFVSIWRKAYQFDAARGNAMTWLYSIARRKAIDRLRMSNREVIGVLEDVACDDNAFDVPVDAVDAESKISMQRYLETLKPDIRRAIRLCYAYGFTHEELATHLNVPLGTAKSWVKQGLQRLKLLMTAGGISQ